MIFQRLRNLWRLSRYEVPQEKKDDFEIIKEILKPKKMAQIIKKTNDIDEFLND